MGHVWSNREPVDFNLVPESDRFIVLGEPIGTLLLGTVRVQGRVVASRRETSNGHRSAPVMGVKVDRLDQPLPRGRRRDRDLMRRGSSCDLAFPSQVAASTVADAVWNDFRAK